MLKWIKATDFCLYTEMEVPLLNVGLVWIHGDNADTTAAISNGTGKSTIPKAITWGLFGDCIDGKRGDEVIRDGAKEARVEIELEDGWRVLRTRKKGAPSLTLFKDGEKFSAGKSEVQEKIDQIVGVDFSAFKNTVLYGQGDTKRFADPAVSDTIRKTMLHKILHTEILPVAHENAKDRLKKAKAELTALEVEEKSLKARIDEHDLVEIEGRIEAWESERDEQRAELLSQAKELAKSAKARLAIDVAPLRAAVATATASLESALESRVALRLAHKEAAAAHSEAAEAQASARAEVSIAYSRVKDAQKALDLIGTDRCPVCTSDLSSGAAADHVQELHRAHSAAKKAHKAADKVSQAAYEATCDMAARVDVAYKAMEEVSIQVSDLRLAVDDAKDALREAEANESEGQALADRAKAALKKARALEEQDNPWKSFLSKTKAQQDVHREKLKDIEAERQEVATRAAHIEFWVRGYSGRGVASFVLDSVMPYLTERTNHYLMTLSDGDIVMSFSTQRELKSSKGEMRDEIDITWTIEGKDNYPPSGGQQRKMEVAADLALMDLCEAREGARMGLFIADEILDGLDQEGVERALTLLQELRAKRGSVFVISHQSSMSEIFEKSILVSKRDGVSTLKRSWR